MRHPASAAFWDAFDELPVEIQTLARKNFELLKQNPSHPSLHFKKVGNYWSVRIDKRHRALATEVDGDMHWHWIGSHQGYDRKTR